MSMNEWTQDVAVLTRRNLVHVRREPMQLSDATIQPVLFTILFVYVFGGAMVLPGGGSYTAFAIGGLVVMNLTTSSVGTAVGLSSDLHTGVINRFRTLPMQHSSILAGRTFSDLLSSILCGTIVLLTGLVIGWSAPNGLLGVIGGLSIAVLFAYAMSWANACVGLSVSDPEAAQGIGFIVIFPLSFISTCFVPSQTMPGWMQPIAEWNPVSSVAAACRDLFGNPNPAALSGSFPAQHPVLMSLGWTAALLVVCVPLAVHLFKRRTLD